MPHADGADKTIWQLFSSFHFPFHIHFINSKGKKVIGLDSIDDLFSDIISRENDLLEDGNDHIFNQIYEKVKESVENRAKSSPEQIKLKHEMAKKRLSETIAKKRSLVPANMLHLTRNTPSEIKRNHLLAKIRRIDRRNTSLKEKLAEYFFPIEQWPNRIIEILLSKHFGYGERIALACFIHGNGLTDKDEGLKIFQFYNQFWGPTQIWNIRFRKFRALFGYLDEAYKMDSETGARIREDYHYFDLRLNLVIYYDGSVKTRNGEKRRYLNSFSFRK